MCKQSLQKRCWYSLFFFVVNEMVASKAGQYAETRCKLLFDQEMEGEATNSMHASYSMHTIEPSPCICHGIQNEFVIGSRRNYDARGRGAPCSTVHPCRAANLVARHGRYIRSQTQYASLDR